LNACRLACARCWSPPPGKAAEHGRGGELIMAADSAVERPALAGLHGRRVVLRGCDLRPWIIARVAGRLPYVEDPLGGGKP
jgi:hypothetical protein